MRTVFFLISFKVSEGSHTEPGHSKASIADGCGNSADFLERRLLEMTLWTEYQNALEHHNALLRAAEQCRLARKALEGHLVWYKGMSWLGSRQSACGAQMQERYGTPAAATTLVTSHSK